LLPLLVPVVSPVAGLLLLLLLLMLLLLQLLLLPKLLLRMLREPTRDGELLHARHICGCIGPLLVLLLWVLLLLLLGKSSCTLLVPSCLLRNALMLESRALLLRPTTLLKGCALLEIGISPLGIESHAAKLRRKAKSALLEVAKLLLLPRHSSSKL